MASLVLRSAAEMHDLGLRLGRMLRAGDLVVLTGALGAGKTTLTRGIGEGLNVRGPVQSPTFVLARTHPNLGDGPPLVHVDAYRLSDARQLDDLDIDFARSAVVVEWGAGMLDGIAEDWLEIVISRATGGTASSTAEGTAVGAQEFDEFDPEATSDEPRELSFHAADGRWVEVVERLVVSE